MNSHRLSTCLRHFGPVSLPGGYLLREGDDRADNNLHNELSKIAREDPRPEWKAERLLSWVTAISATDPPVRAVIRITHALHVYRVNFVREIWARVRKEIFPDFFAAFPDFSDSYVRTNDLPPDLRPARRLCEALRTFGPVVLDGAFRELRPDLANYGYSVRLRAGAGPGPAIEITTADGSDSDPVDVDSARFSLDMLTCMYSKVLVTRSPPDTAALVALATLHPDVARPIWAQWRSSFVIPPETTSAMERLIQRPVLREKTTCIDPARFYNALFMFGEICGSATYRKLVPEWPKSDAPVRLFAASATNEFGQSAPAVYIQDMVTGTVEALLISDLSLPHEVEMDLRAAAAAMSISPTTKGLVAIAALPQRESVQLWDILLTVAPDINIQTKRAMETLLNLTPATGEKMVTTNNPTAKDRAVKATKGTAAMLGTAAKQAVVQQASAMVAEGMVRIVRQTAGDAWPPFLDTPIGQVIAKISVPVLIHAALEAFDANDDMLLAVQVRELAAAAVQGTAVEASRDLMQLLGPILVEMAALTTTLNAGLLTPKTAADADDRADDRAVRSYLPEI